MRTTIFQASVVTLLTFTGAALTACADPIKDAERRYEMVKKSSASAAEVCAEGRRLGDAYLAANNGDKYRDSRLTLDLECSSRQDEEERGIGRDAHGNEMAPIEADNMAAPIIDR